MAPSCSEVLQTVELKINNSAAKEQVEFNVLETTLSISEAQTQNKSPFLREIMQSGRGDNAKPIAENIILNSKFPEQSFYNEYKIGVGDKIELARLIDNTNSELLKKVNWPKKTKRTDYVLGVGDQLSLLQIVEGYETRPLSSSKSEEDSIIIKPLEEVEQFIEARGRVGSDGSVLLLEVGRLEAAGKTLNELRSEVRNILIRNGSSTRFQLEINTFNSQRAYLTLNNVSSVIPLNDQKMDIRDVLSTAGKGFEPGVVTRVKLQRGNQVYQMRLRQIFSKEAPEILVKDRDHIFVEDSRSSTVVTQSIVGQDGNIILAGVGKVTAIGKTLDELEKEVYQLTERLPDSLNALQLEISGFSSKNALISIPNQSNGVIPITNKNISLEQILIDKGVATDGKSVVRIKLDRKGNQYSFTLGALLNNDKNTVRLEPNDRIIIDILSYKPSKVFILGGVKPNIVNIDPMQRQTLADILFTPGGVLDSPSAKRSEVYLLRGKNPVKAFHLDAQNPARLLVANALELRPNDILYVAEQPIMSFNRTLAAIVPLRLLLRDIQDENIP